MLDKDQILSLFQALSQELARRDVMGEAGICGGAAMCLAFNARAATKDVDAIFKPTQEVREAARKVGHDLGISEDWLNDAVKGFFLTDPPKQDVLNLPNLRVWAPTPQYMLAMKCISARFDTADKDDVMFLIRLLRLEKKEDVFEIISSYYPRSAIPAKTQFLVEELFDS